MSNEDVRREEIAHQLAKLLNRFGYIVIATPQKLALDEEFRGFDKDVNGRMKVVGSSTFEEYVKQVSSFGRGVQMNIHVVKKLNFYKVVMETTDDPGTNGNRA